MVRLFRYFVNGTRAYTLTLEKDLLGDWVVRRTWGPTKNPYSQKRVEVFENEKDALTRFEALVHYRIHTRGYQCAPKFKLFLKTPIKKNKTRAEVQKSYTHPKFPGKNDLSHKKENKCSLRK